MINVKLLIIYLLAIILLLSCVQAKFNWILTLETEHFKFYTVDKDEKVVLQLADILEKNYKRITTDFRVSETLQFPVYVAPDIKSYHKVIGRPNSSQWSVGTVKGTEIWIVSPLNSGSVHDTKAVLTIGVHEFTHAVVNYVNGSLHKNNYRIPIWLNEGLAVYESGQMIPEWRARLKERVSEGKIPSIKDDFVSGRFGRVGGYPFSATLVEYLIAEYGFEKIIAIIKTPSELESILGVTIIELDAAWRNYLKERY